ncbi:MAG: hypothetical protein KJ556_20210 [Gammaproteobacteria bacterium]|nr:hypothetical protein [Gammaproteobacteria bacterium]MBU2249158.1 hypothetical protein [Gammaproteobacteria bacterium]
MNETEIRKLLARHTGVNDWWKSLTLEQKLEIRHQYLSKAKAALEDSTIDIGESLRRIMPIPDPFPMEAGIGITKGLKREEEKK